MIRDSMAAMKVFVNGEGEWSAATAWQTAGRRQAIRPGAGRCRSRNARLLVLQLSLAVATFVRAQEAGNTVAAAPDATTLAAEPVPVRLATDVVGQWRPGQHLYVKGDLGIGAPQLAQLEQWLRQNAPHWTVVLLASAQDERYTDADGQSFSGLDAVEHALGKGLPNQTAFSQWTDPRTGERNGAFFVLFLKERKFSYFGSDAQDRRGLGEDRWQGRLDQPAIAAMRSGGRIVDAVKDTITSIERQLTQRITAEKADAERRAAAARVAQQRAIEQARASLQTASASVDLLDQKLAGLRTEQPDLSGDVARPDVPQMRADLQAAQAAFEGENFAAVGALTGQVKQRAQAAVRAVEQYGPAGPELAALRSEIAATASQPYGDAAQSALETARQQLATAAAAHARGDSAYAAPLIAARQHLRTAQARVAAAARAAVWQRQLAMGGAGLGLAALLGLGVGLNRRRRGSKRDAEALLGAWSTALNEKSSALVELLDRTQTILGNSAEAVAVRFAGQSLQLGQQTIRDVDELFIMSACAGRIHRDTLALVQPAGWAARVTSLFAARRYRAAIRRLRDQPIAFRPEEGLELVLRGRKSARDTLLGSLESYQPFTLSFSELIAAFNERATRALAALDQLESSLSTVDGVLEATEKSLQSVQTQAATWLAAGGSEGWFQLAPMFDALLPAAQSELASARHTAVRDPVGALQGAGARARRQAADAGALARLAARFHQEIAPRLQAAGEKLAAVPLATAWLAQAATELSARADALARHALQNSVPEDIGRLQTGLEQLADRAETVVRLDQSRREVAQTALPEADALIAEARRELAVPLQVAPDTILREPELDPSARLAAAGEQMAGVKAALERGDVAAAQAGLEAVTQLVQEARSLVADTREAFAAHAATLTACQQETARLEKELPAHEQILVALESGYVPGVLMLGAGDATHPNANGTVQDNVREVREHLAAARDFTDRAGRRFRDAQLLQAAEDLEQVAAWHEQARFRLQEVVDKHQRLGDTEAANDRLAAELATQARAIEVSVADARTMQSTREMFHAALEQMAAANRLRSARPRDPFKVAAELAAVRTALERVQEQAPRDWAVFAEADRSVQAAAAQLAVAGRLSQQAAADAVADSAAIHQARHELAPLADALAQAQMALSARHGDWSQLDAEADRLTSEAGRIAAVFRGEMEAAQAALASVAAAAGTIRAASGWTGLLGVAIFGAPGSDALAQARACMERGDYGQARRLAEAAHRSAEVAIAEAEAEVRRRRRAEEERRERERRRRAEEERRRQRSFSHSSFGSSRSGVGRSSFSSHSGAGRSSFSRGSGVGRSGW